MNFPHHQSKSLTWLTVDLKSASSDRYERIPMVAFWAILRAWTDLAHFHCFMNTYKFAQM